ncbi:hypothetical protein GCM10025875_10680 [Litorihabitans aurantiacus]|uniref:Uncharacterized protein n=1 Tax=Litorihabitans aurantiacus TaxID=1930061 RepID=A0AA37UQ97_9MICO|nr:hypothetical protein GCM10025875_10680 [Litorihabitans aurantiacus]
MVTVPLIGTGAAVAMAVGASARAVIEASVRPAPRMRRFIRSLSGGAAARADAPPGFRRAVSGTQCWFRPTRPPAGADAVVAPGTVSALRVTGALPVRYLRGRPSVSPSTSALAPGTQTTAGPDAMRPTPRSWCSVPGSRPAERCSERVAQMAVMFEACGPLGPCVTSKETRWFSSSER